MSIISLSLIPQLLASQQEVILILIAMICQYLTFVGHPQDVMHAFLESANVRISRQMKQWA